MAEVGTTRVRAATANVVREAEILGQPAEGLRPAEPTRPEEPQEAKQRHPRRLAALVCLVSLVLTGASTWATARADANTEQRLLQVQTKQAAAVLSTAILLIQEPLDTVLSVEKVAGPAGDATAFRRLTAGYVGPGKAFVSASLWRRTGSVLTRVASVGTVPALVPGRRATTAYLLRAFGEPTFVVRSVHVGTQSRVAYAEADRGSGFVVYAEREIPADRRSPVDRNSAFADLHYALYLGPGTRTANLSTTDMDPGSLPLQGHTSQITVPFGTTVLTFVTSSRQHLGAPLSQRLPVILLLGGLLLAALASRSTFQLVRGRQRAEHGEETITELYKRVGHLYGQQRDLAERLQRALLPHAHPIIPGLEIASEYVAGATGVDIGGDWYSVIGIDEQRFAFVVGDVSGRGVDAVAVMAHARFTLRAYLLDGNGPAEALEKCSHQFDITVDGHMTTALVGIGNAQTGEVVLANAGHPTPLLMTPGGSSFVEVPPGRPLGTGPDGYEEVTFTVPRGGTLVAFTDGLVERRREDIDAGMARLADTLAGCSDEPAQDVVARAVATLRHDDAPDDIAILAVRWVV